MRRDLPNSEWLWIGIFCAYFIVQTVLRLTVHGDALELDEAEAFWFARHLAPGYGAQPPLYFWLQWMVFELVGPSIAALAILKNTILAGAAVTVFRIIRRFAPPALAGAATLSLALLPEISWEAQRALTHSALIFLFSALTLLTFERMLRNGSWANYLLFGCVLGLGMLSKHNFHLLWIALALAVVTDGRLRTALIYPRLAGGFAVVCLLLLPYLFWAAAHPDLATASAQKLGLSGGSALAARVLGLADLAGMLAGFFGLAVVWLGLPLVIRRRQLMPVPSDSVRILWRVSIMSLVIVLALVIVAGVTNIRGRWIMPLVWPVVPLAVVALWPALAARGRLILSASLAGLWLAVMIALPLVQSYRDADFRHAYAGLPGDMPIVVAQTWVLGNLALIAPDRPIQMASVEAPLPESAVLIAPKGGLEALAGTLGYAPRGGMQTFDLGPINFRRDFEFAVVTRQSSG